MDAVPAGNPLFEEDIASLEDEPQLLAVHAARLGEAVVEIDQGPVGVADRTLDLVLEAAAGPGRRLGRDDLARPEPAGEEVEEMDAVLDKDAAAFRAVPEPVLRAEPLVGGVVLEVAVQEAAQRLPVDQRFDRVEERVVALHQVRGQQQAAFAGGGHQFVGLLDRDGQRLFADDVLAVLECGQRLLVMQKRRRGDIDQVDVVAIEQRFDLLDVRHAEAAGGGHRCFAMRSRHGDRLHARQLREMLQGKQAEPATADYAQSNHERLLK